MLLFRSDKTSEPQSAHLPLASQQTSSFPAAIVPRWDGCVMRPAVASVNETRSEDGGMNSETPRLRRAKRQTPNFKHSTSKAHCETLDGSSSRCGPVAQTSGV